MANRKQPGGLAIWLGVADSSFTRQKTVKFGDASAVNSGRLWSIVTVVALIVAWSITTVGGVIDPIFWPPLEGGLYPWDNPNRAKPGVIDRFMGLLSEGYRNISLWEHVGTSVKRVLLGVFFGALAGIPLGFAMGLNSAARGLFDPIVEFVRPIPPLALIPLVILWLGIDEVAKVFLLFLAALFIMLIAARAGVSSVQISKVHAAYSLGASKTQVLRHVILPNALPEIFTGLRTSMGVCWGTLVAAELVAADQGVGSMMMIAKNFLQTDVVVIGIIIIGAIGFAIEMLMRALEAWLIPWKGKG
ncbi:MAG: ABC transporter permease subunit [Defluviicoccus sp.]|nr:ABC transporter permease subunit [Defluviicoccus sp.]